MNKFAIFLLIVQLVSLQETYGLQIPCSNKLGGNCDSVNNNNISQEPLDTILSTLRNGFNVSKACLKDSENAILNGLSEASKLAQTQANSALKILQDATSESKTKLLESGIYFFSSLGRALKMSNFKARKQLIQACQQPQFIAINILERLRTVRASTSQDISVLKNPSMKVIEGLRRDIQADFEDMYAQLQNTLQKAIQAVSNIPKESMDDRTTLRSIHVPSEDNEAQAIISEINKIAQESLDNGADASKVELLRNSLITSFGDFADSVSFLLETFSNALESADSDLPSTRNLILEKDEEFYKQIQKIFSNICLEIGSVSDDITLKRIGKALVTVERGFDAISSANIIAKKMMLDALSYEGELRENMVNRALNIVQDGEMKFLENVVNGAKVIFDDL